MLKLTPLRRLDVTKANGQPGYLSAASGLVTIGDYLHVIADDELSLASFSRHRLDLPGQLLTLLPGQLPVDKQARKRQKPDWEALMFLPTSPISAGHPYGALLALGSGSKPSRSHAALIGLTETGAATGEVTTYSLLPFYEAVQKKLPELNVEAAFLRADQIHLVSRGNRSHPVSTVISCDRRDWLACLVDPNCPVPRLSMHSLTLPSLDDVVASVSDAVALPDGWLATAIAEATDDSYHDGACVGAALARFDARHRLVGWWPLSEPIKVEGLIAEPTAAGWDLQLVNDPDDPAIPAALYQCKLPR